MKKDVVIFAIETSCDDTSVSISRNDKILANLTANQAIHEMYGGVVPELASRDHQKNIVPVSIEALKQSGIQWNEIDAIAFTEGPGLIGSLLVGASFAKSIAQALSKPLIGVHHMQAHILANFIEKETTNAPMEAGKPEFPFICLTVSGGHTQLVLVNDYFSFVVLGETKDDAAGEAFDKAAKLLGLPYPGGPYLDKLAMSGDPLKIRFSKSNIPDFDFSFSGIKTSLLYFLQDELKKNHNYIKENIHDICASYQKNVVDCLLEKLKKAIEKTKVKSFALAGGVSANSELRRRALKLGKEMNCKVHIPLLEHCTDNAAMIAVTAYYKYLQGNFSELNTVPKARWDL